MTVLAVIGGLFATTAPAGASSGPFTPSVVSTTTTVNTICRAYGGSLSANTEADQALSYTVTAPDAVQPGETFNIKIKQPFSAYPRTDTSTGTTANIVAVYNQITKWQLPAGLTINSVSLAPINGDTAANADAGYYVAPADVPTVTISGQGTIPDPNFDPMTLPAAKRIAVPGTAPAGLFDASTNTVRLGMLGTGTESGGSVFAAGSIVQAPALTVNVTAKTTVAAGTDLGIKLAGQLPSGSFTGGQPGNFPAPSTISVNRTTVTSSDSTWTNPSYVNYVHTTALGGLITVIAKAACAPGWEATSQFPTAPAYYTGPNAIPNGTAPPLNSTKVVGIGSTSPFEGAKYVTGSTPDPIAYSCIANPAGETYDTCVGDQPNGATIDTSTPGDYTFTINATDAYQAPISRTIHYSVVDPVAPVVNAGAAQAGKVAGNVVTLDGSATDANGPPALPLTYTWTQTSGPTVALSNANAAKPTFTVPAVDNPTGYSFGFDLAVSNGYLSSTASTTVTANPSTPTVAVVKTRPPGGTSFFTGDIVTLAANITNPDGTASADYTYDWAQIGGITTALSSNTVANPTYKIPANGSAACTSGSGATNCPTYRVIVTKTNTGKVSAVANLANYGTTLATRPVANAGANQTLPNSGGAVTLDGSASTQAQSHPISYAWTQVANGAPTVTLSDPAAQKPTFTAPASGATTTNYVFQLIVTDTQNPVAGNGTGGNTSPAVTTTVAVVADTVVASASASPASGVAGTAVTLDGSASTDPNLAPLSYSWTQVDNGAPTVTIVNPTAQKPTFTAPAAASPTGYTAQFNLTVTNGGPNPGDTATTTTPVSVTIAASTPTATVAKAREGGGTTFYVGDKVTLTANITNPDGTNPADYTYLWSQVSGITTALSSNTAANPTYIIPPNGSAVCASGTGATNCPRFQVIVTKTNTGKSSAAAALANYGSTLPNRPVANAGTAQSVKVGSTVTLNGSGTQQQGHPLSYAWTQTTGTTVALSSSTVAQPTFTAPNAGGTATFSLVVTDFQNGITGSGTNGKTSTASTVTITFTDYTPPTASAGSDQSTYVGTTDITLNGSGTQADGHTLSYSWTQTSGTVVGLSDVHAQNPTFTAPNSGGDLKFTVTVTDTQNPNPATNSTTSAAVTVTVNSYASPTADAGDDQTVQAATSPVTLSGSGTQADGHTLSYSWTQTSGTVVSLSDASSATPSFTAPSTGGDLEFTLTVTDTQNPDISTNSATSTVTVTVQSYGTPTANAGTNQTVYAGTDPVTLSGSGTQADGHTLSYSWTQTSGTVVSLSDASSASTTFAAPTTGGDLQFTLTVTDTQNPDINTNSATSSVTVTVQSYASPVANAGLHVTVPVGTEGVQLDGSGSSQADGHTLSYSWTQTSGTGVTLSDASSATPTFTAPDTSGDLEFTLTVTDTQNPDPATNTASASVVISIGDYSSPIANAGTNQTVYVGAAPVTLNASGSSQLDGHSLSYEWTQTSGEGVDLSSSSAVQPTFTAPFGAGDLTFTVTVTDTENPNPAVNTATASVTISVIDFPAISGTVTDEDGNPVSGVAVAAFAGSDTTPTATYTTENDGLYSMSVPAGTYTVSFTPLPEANLLGEWFDDQSSRATATPVVVANGANVTDVDAELATAVVPTVGSIHGTVTDGNGDPLAGVTVFALPPGSLVGTSTVTAANGTYTLADLDPGTYTVLFVPPGGSGLLAQWWDHAADLAHASTLEVTAGVATNDIDAQLVLGGSFSGTVTDSSAHPLAGIKVQAFAPTDTFFPSYSTVTAADGTYSLSAIATGTYQLRFAADPGAGLVNEWYNNVLVRTTATALNVTPGVHMDLSAALATSTTLSGTVTAGGSPVANVNVQVYSQTDTVYASFGTSTAANGTYSVSGLPSGTYQVRFVPPTGSGLQTKWYNGAATRTASTPVVLSGGTVGGINASLAAPSSISGVVTNSGGSPVSGVVVWLYKPTDTTAGSYKTTTAADGSYTFGDVAAGSYQVRFAPAAGSGYAVQWYDHVTTRTASTLVTVATGQAITGRNAVLVAL